MKNIGLDIKVPDRTCTDPHCPFHGSLKVRGQILKGIVVSTKMMRTVVVRREYYKFDKKYERFAKKVSKYHVHLPDCIRVEPGDTVRFMECRPLAKTVAFVVVEKNPR